MKNKCSVSVENFSGKASRKVDLNPRFPMKVKGSRKEIEPYFNCLQECDAKQGQTAQYYSLNERCKQSKRDYSSNTNPIGVFCTLHEDDNKLHEDIINKLSKQPPLKSLLKNQPISEHTKFELDSHKSSSIKKKSTTGIQVNMYHCRECRSHIRYNKKFGTTIITESDSEINISPSPSSSLSEYIKRDMVGEYPIKEERMLYRSVVREATGDNVLSDSIINKTSSCNIIKKSSATCRKRDGGSCVSQNQHYLKDSLLENHEIKNYDEMCSKRLKMLSCYSQDLEPSIVVRTEDNKKASNSGSKSTSIKFDGNILQQICEKELLVFTITTKCLLLILISTLVIMYLIYIDFLTVLKTTIYYFFPILKKTFELKKPPSMFQTVYNYIFSDIICLFPSQCPC